MKNKAFLLILTVLLLLIGITTVVFLRSRQNNELPANLYKQFKCDNPIDEGFSTHKYCNDYDLYKKDHAAGII